MKIDYVSIGARIRYHRVKNGLSQEELAERSELSRVYISYIESGERNVSLDSIITIANILNISADDLLEDNLFATLNSESYGQKDALLDCSAEESSILIEAMEALKSIIRKYKITK